MHRADGRTAPVVAAYVVVIAAALVVVAAAAPAVWSATQRGPGTPPTVAVISVTGPTNDATVDAVTRSLRQARQNSSVAAVVLSVDSPGGPVDSSEELYLAVNRTAQELPVVAYVEGVAASGGYYAIAPADRIIVKPSSTVGSIGVVVQAPLSEVEAAEREGERFVRSGPDKAQVDRDRLREDLERLQRAFVGTVMRHRGENLTLSATAVASGRTYLGTAAVENGFADEIGDVELAIATAAARSQRIDGDEYTVDYSEPGPAPTVIVLDGSVERVEGDIVYVDQRADEGSQFVEPVTYYAVWGVPRGNATVESAPEVPADG